MAVVDGRQIRAARAILGWTTTELADAARVHRNSVTRTEGMETLPDQAWAADRLAQALEAAGIVFGISEAGPSVSFRAPRSRVASAVAA